MALTPQYAATPKLAVATVSTANTARDGTGTIATVLTAGTNGTRVRRIEVQATGTTTAGMVRIFLHNGTSAFLYHEFAVTAITPSATVQAFSANITEGINPDLLPLTIPSSWSVRASTNNAESFNVFVEGADL